MEAHEADARQETGARLRTKAVRGPKRCDGADLPPIASAEDLTVVSGWASGAVLRLRALWPGLSICVVLALSAAFMSDHYGGPTLLYALLFGLALNFLSLNPVTAEGIGFCARTVLRLGVALLGARITVGQIAELGVSTALLVIGSLAATILFGLGLARLLGSPREQGLLSGAAVGICGASAALAVSSVLPPTRDNERFTLLTVVGVTLLSTLAMVVYPLLIGVLGMAPVAAGVFLGASIHDVAQVAAAGSLLGPEVAETAVIIKLLRVVMLAPVVLLAAVLLSTRGVRARGGAAPLVPGFLIGFALLVLIASMGLISGPAAEAASSASRACLVVAIAASGLKTHFSELAQLGWRPLVLLLAETVFLAALVAIALHTGF